MKIYRNHLEAEGGISGGYTWHSSKTAAKQAARKVETLEAARPYDITLTKRGVIAFLNAFGSHPDNG